MRIIQYRNDRGKRHVGLVDADGRHAMPLKGLATVYQLANQALAKRVRLARLAGELATGRRVDYAGLLGAGQVLAPLD
ncbi:MAG: FAH family protein, partial [Pseudomonadota bacterium]|nr:FAH family protein [Pseudomonadota bacterium]